MEPKSIVTVYANARRNICDAVNAAIASGIPCEAVQDMMGNIYTEVKGLAEREKMLAEKGGREDV